MKYVLLVTCALLATYGKMQGQEIDTARTPKIFQYVDQLPSCPYSLNEYLSTNLKYPKKAIEKDIEGRVIVKFVVNEDGKITDAVVVRGVDELLDAEALRVVNAMPPWKPGKQNGKEVKVYFNLPIVFKLEDDDPPKKDGEPTWKKK